ncbi:MAG: L-ribulose-5-phosphate 3-epimerase [Oscillospiraceae bacterium]|nr:L-ribulose-5-phosphate 3-epimerase [Oscillospiraceae bacterium]
MEENRSYSLGLYEKAIPVGMTFPQMFAIAKQCGFDRLEISVDETDWRQERLEWDASRQRELGALSRAMDAPLLTMCLSGHRKYPFGSHDSETRRRSLDIMEKAVRFADNAGISVIQLAGYDVYYEQGDEDTRKWFAENLRRSVDMAAKAGVVLAFETMETPFMDTVEKSMKYVSEIGSPWLGVYPDIGNLKNAAVLYGTDVVEDMMLGAGHIFAVHLKETKPGLYRDMNFGDSTGHTEYERCIEASLRMGVRMFTGEFWYQKGQDYMSVIADSAKFLREKIEASAENLAH